MIDILKQLIMEYESIDKEFDTCLQSNGKIGDWDEIRKRALDKFDEISKTYHFIISEAEKYKEWADRAKTVIDTKKLKL